ncbi:RNase H family protein [Endomicrobium proavitum]|uniref:Putative ribonuclease HI n=1 Tax=Endomicrobium proavitum TaxID=1408281 RepID=A0A0G3WMD1_9BACT|nr:RNase H family protein [Endomicrobium proavitum]AKL98644.1 putative ribonuclease HI [Endomicrobium proavitum]
MTLCKDELQKKAQELCAALKIDNIEAKFSNESFRDYLVVLELARGAGKLSLYYKPSAKTYSLKKKITDKNIEAAINKIWDSLTGVKTYAAASGIYEAFVDGSFIGGAVGYGAVIYLGDEVKAELSGTIEDVQFRQFGGELKSVIETLKWCEKNNVARVRINYDYEGIEKFATGVWQPKNDLSKEYAQFVKNSKIALQWRHIKSHTGNSKNDFADKLAKEAALSAAKNILI